MRVTRTEIPGAFIIEPVVHRGCAHGFCVMSPVAYVQYKCTALYDPADELGIAYDDPALAIRWPVEAPVISERDRCHPAWRMCATDSRRCASKS